jgi:hypothetical protein
MKNMKSFVILLLCLAYTGAFAQQKYGKGMVFDNREYEQAALSAPLIKSDYDDLPNQYDLKQYCPGIKSQGRQGTCVGWATAYYGRTIMRAIEKGYTRTSSITDIAFSPTYVYEQIKNSSGCLQGTVLIEALDLIQDQGVPMLKDCPYVCGYSITDDMRRKAAGFKIAGYKALFTFEASDNTKINTIKKAIAEKRPVVIGMVSPESFQYATDRWEPAPGDDPNNFNVGGHAMAVVGYDNDKYGGAMLLINSWGDDWGNNGYTWISYDHFSDYCKYAFEMIPGPKPGPEKIELKGAITFKKSSGDLMPAARVAKTKEFNVVTDKSGEDMLSYHMKDKYVSGTRFKFFISSAKESYIYALGSASGGKVNKIFPYEKLSAYFGYSKATMAYPAEDASVEMTKPAAGQDFFIILYAKEKVDIDKLIDKMNAATGTYSKKLKNALASRLIQPGKCNFSASQIAFQAPVNGPADIVTVMIKFEYQ